MMLDDLDFRLLKELKLDSRRSVRQLAKSLEESPSTVYNRVKRLESKNVIKNFTISIDFDQLELNTVAFIFVSLKSPEMVEIGQLEIREMANEVAAIPQVCEVHLISGEFDLLVKVRSKSLKTIGEFVIDELRSKMYVRKTMTIACFETIKEEEINIDVPNLVELLN